MRVCDRCRSFLEDESKNKILIIRKNILNKDRPKIIQQRIKPKDNSCFVNRDLPVLSESEYELCDECAKEIHIIINNYIFKEEGNNDTTPTNV